MEKHITLSGRGAYGITLEIRIHQKTNRILHEATYTVVVGEISQPGGDVDYLGQEIGRELVDQLRRQIAGVKDAG